MKTKLTTVFALLLATGASVPAHAGIDLSVFEMNNLSEFSTNPTAAGSGNSMGFGLGFGVGGTYQVMPDTLALELDVMYLQNKMVLTATGSPNASVTFSGLQIPLIVRYIGWPMFSVGAGLLYNLEMGQFSNNDGTTTTNLNYADFNFNTSALGMLLAAGVKLPIGTNTNFVGDLRYVLGLGNYSTFPGQSTKINSIQLMLGVSFAL